MNEFLPWFPLTTLEETQQFLQERFLDYYKKKRSYRYVVCLKGQKGIIGYVWLSDDESCDFGYALKKEYWNQGIITEAAKEVLKRIKKSGILMITATHDIKNPRSGAVMEKLGMIYQHSYKELWQPKNKEVIFRLFQMNLDGSSLGYQKYKEKYGEWVEK